MNDSVRNASTYLQRTGCSTDGGAGHGEITASFFATERNPRHTYYTMPILQQAVQEALEAASRHRTTICIAHRLSTIQNADAIAVVRDGAVVEVGAHTELMAKNRLYAEMVRTQMREDQRSD